MSRVLSFFRSDDGFEEYLSDHIKGCLMYLRSIESSRLWRYGSKLSHNFKDTLRISVIFHDLGKAFFKKSHGRLYFTGHEIISSIILSQYYSSQLQSTQLEYDDPSIVLEPAIFAVAFHHHPMGLNDRLKRLRELEREKIVYIDQSSINSLKYELTFLKDEIIDENEYSLICNILDDLGKWRIQDLLKNFEENVKNSLFDIFTCSKEECIIVKKLSYLSLSALVAVDYLSAEVRGGGTDFIHVIREFHRHYLT